MVAGIDVLAELLDALSFAFGMFWEILWALILGFAHSAAVQAVVSKQEMRRLMPDDSPRTLGIACGLGRRLVVVLLRRGRIGALALPQGREVHGGDGIRVRLDQSGHRAREHHGAVARLAVHARRVRRRPADDRADGARLPPLPQAAPRRRGARGQADRGVLGRMEGHAEMECPWTSRGRFGADRPRLAASPRPRTTSSWTGRRSGSTSSAGS